MSSPTPSWKNCVNKDYCDRELCMNSLFRPEMCNAWVPGSKAAAQPEPEPAKAEELYPWLA